MKKDIPAELWSNPKEEYGDRYADHLLEQYRAYLESAEGVSSRRSSANTFLLSANAALAAAAGFAPAETAKYLPWAGLALAAAWFFLLWNYRSLNAAKFLIVHELEARLPVAPFDAEWKLLQHGDGAAYTRLTFIEQAIPVVFFVLYLVILCAN